MNNYFVCKLYRMYIIFLFLEYTRCRIDNFIHKKSLVWYFFQIFLTIYRYLQNWDAKICQYIFVESWCQSGLSSLVMLCQMPHPIQVHAIYNWRERDIDSQEISFWLIITQNCKILCHRRTLDISSINQNVLPLLPLCWYY